MIKPRHLDVLLRRRLVTKCVLWTFCQAYVMIVYIIRDTTHPPKRHSDISQLNLTLKTRGAILWICLQSV
jgi:hypothetical protein